MKVALVHDYLNQFGGAERVLMAFAEMFPEAPIYTIFYDKELLNGRFKDKKIHTSFLDRSFIRRHHRYFIPLMPTAMRNLDLGDEYDLIISDTASFGKGIRHKKGLHISYMHTPLRYAWEPELYLNTLLPNSAITLATPIISYLRNWDRAAAQKPHIVLANSKFIADKINKFYGRDAEIIYPPVDTDTFYRETSEDTRGDYFLAFGRIVHFKRFDLVVEAFNEINLPLKIVGSGSEKPYIKQLVKSKLIEMIDEVKDEGELRKIINNARAVIFPQIEDFGLVAAESIACGTPVIAYAKGGALEIIKDGRNGLLFNEQTPQSLRSAIQKFQGIKFNRATVSKSAEIFSKKTFQKEFNKILQKHLKVTQTKDNSPL
ncbi:MAG: hypothetical protein A3D47_00635 [Candidatus Colwellbacteria bacterium RIFCSPHIGHO2_02_FULL_43_15]|uniref:Glycosyl transferase family 1 domain-containing protein n=1 Tax=Candidatus Colwellbacteria bacterium RIFCSPHIGHO2_02_FULL_43_15 TaxID=1797686 RepID=A0A1G1Z032_9BACT|nr:MAG: hypothetical protein A3D47_00635 [Candidatus Colwellbacteria bacterium RIFCSPHIGHO2_02_FULL_43_15]